METQTQETEVRRLPLWKACLDDMRKDGISYGQVYKAEFFEEKLRAKRDEMQYGLGISEIRRELEKDGFYITGQGQKSAQLIILQPSANADVMEHYSRMASDSLARSVILGSNTKRDLMSDQERNRHDKVLERVAIKAALLRRASSVSNCVKKHLPKLLGGGA